MIALDISRIEVGDRVEAWSDNNKTEDAVQLGVVMRIVENAQSRTMFIRTAVVEELVESEVPFGQTVNLVC